MNDKSRIIVALDVSDLETVDRLIVDLAPHVAAFKIGHQLITRFGGPRVVEFVQSRGGKVFYDGKFYDIPNTVREASLAVAEMGVWAFNVALQCGPRSIEAAVKTKGGSLLFGVSVLTSISPAELWSANIHSCFRMNVFRGALPDQEDYLHSLVISLAVSGELAGMDGLICSPQEVRSDRKVLQITPGCRPTWASKDDQARVMTPGEAAKVGADYLVIGRPILKPPAEIGSSVEAAKLINQEVVEVLAAKAAAG